MRSFITRPRALAVLVAGTALTFSPLGGQATAKLPADQLSNPCLTPAEGPAARGGHGADHRELSAAEQKAIDAKTAQILKAKAARGLTPQAGQLAAASVPVYVHVMRSSSGAGDVTNSQTPCRTPRRKVVPAAAARPAATPARCPVWTRSTTTWTTRTTPATTSSLPVRAPGSATCGRRNGRDV